MIIFSLFPGGVLQLKDVLDHGYWHARSEAFSSERNARLIEWLRLGPDVIFIVFGSIPITLAALTAYRYLQSPTLR